MEIGQYNELKVTRSSSVGLFLSDGTDDVLLPQRYVPEGTQEGDTLNVFVYLDNESRPVATTLKPYATVNQFAYLQVKQVNEHGAFLDWGIDKDLFVPYSEQRIDMQKDKNYLVYVFIDEKSGRIAGSARWRQFVSDDVDELDGGEEVEVIIAEKTDLGYRAIINNKFEGMIFKNEVFEELNVGDERRAFVKQIREDGKIDLSLQAKGYEHIKDLKDVILHRLKENKGMLALGDKSSPDQIYEQLKISKKAFKKTIGGLYKERIIDIDDFEIRLASDPE
jgi:uncharacterized protein